MEFYQDINNEKILYLKDILVNKLPDNFQCEHSLSLEGSSITSLPDGLFVDGNLYLQNSKITELPSDLVVGGEIYLDTNLPIPETAIINGKNYPDGLYRDKIVIAQNKIMRYSISYKKEAEDLRLPHSIIIYKNKNDISPKFIVNYVDYWHPCDDLHEGMLSLDKYLFEQRGGNKYKDLDRQTKFSVSQAAEMYKTITGACDKGVKEYIDNLSEEEKNKIYTLEELIIKFKSIEWKHNYLFTNLFDNN